MDAGPVSEFDGNVFDSAVFANVKKLHFKNLKLLTIWEFEMRPSIFIGLHALEELMITNSALKVFDNGWLNNINGTIRSLIITGMGLEKPLSMEMLTGGTARSLTNVSFVKIQYNLANSINNRSFTAIPNVRELDLSDCGILVIGESSFQALGSNLKLLNLERNGLKTLPSDIFSSLSLISSPSPQQLDESYLMIRLSGNPWECNCTLSHLKDLLIANANFVGEELVCATPEDIINYPIREAIFCPSIVTTTLATTEVTTVAIDDDNGIEKECLSYSEVGSKNKISMQPRMQQIRLIDTSEGVSVILENYSKDLTLIWFETEKISHGSQNSNLSNCLVDLSNTILINDLKEDTGYTFCVMNTSRKTASPLDCMSYYNHGKPEQFSTVWLYEGSKPLAISIVVVACTANIIIGMIVGATISKPNGFNFLSVFVFWNASHQKAFDSNLR